MTRARAFYALVVAMAVPSACALAWLGKGHRQVVEIAVRGAAASATSADALPEFFVRGIATIAHCSLDPDNFTRPIAGRLLHDAEAPEHYFDLELVEDMKLPPTRYEFLEAVIGKGLKPSRVGLLPYAVAEWTQRLEISFAEHRKWPGNPYIRQKCLVYAGILSHYAADACQPLHTTIHYDGRALPDGSSPRKGMHLKIDALLGKVAAAEGPVPSEVVTYEDVLAAALDEVLAAHALVDKVYEMEPDLPDEQEAMDEGSEVQKFAARRLKRAATFTACLYMTAWRKSGKASLPDWLTRDPGPTSAPAAPN